MVFNTDDPKYGGSGFTNKNSSTPMAGCCFYIRTYNKKIRKLPKSFLNKGDSFHKMCYNKTSF
ncbi:hypothetical protein [Eubacterium callanderi]|uniref:hypothetical protein n=1 Tax=Eubacterium callanderi TaxID=53442 RepID=UPI002108B973|nr:hypothetical protein [Eubacterium callanderi]MCQ4822972.1 hypothetical protein [Eubacterium callanderi]